MSDAQDPTRASRVFISYRREETAYPAGWLYDRLDDRFGDAQVFKDVDSIPLGDDFVEAITRAVGSCDVLLALIGDRWLTIADERGRRRLDDPHDFVRLEIEAALLRNVRVIPVLVDGARMPRADELPDSMANLVRRQALELTPSRFESDTNRLVKVLASTLAEVRAAQQHGGEHVAAAEGDGTAGANVREAPAPAGSADRKSRRVPILAAVAVAVAALAVIAIVIVAADDEDGATAPAAGGFDVDTATVTSPDELELTGLAVSATNEPPQVGDTVTVRYSLTNVTDEPVQFENTFVGARDDADGNHDSEDMNEGVELAPGESLDAQGRVLIDSAGAWEVWPCYELATGQVCPDKWQVTAFLVG
jgi:hypothetical protein